MHKFGSIIEFKKTIHSIAVVGRRALRMVFQYIFIEWHLVVKFVLPTILYACASQTQSEFSRRIAETPVKLSDSGAKSDLVQCVYLRTRIERSECAEKVFRQWSSGENVGIDLTATAEELNLKEKVLCGDFADLIYKIEVQGERFRIEEMEFRNRCAITVQDKVESVNKTQLSH